MISKLGYDIKTRLGYLMRQGPVCPLVMRKCYLQLRMAQMPCRRGASQQKWGTVTSPMRGTAFLPCFSKGLTPRFQSGRTWDLKPEETCSWIYHILGLGKWLNIWQHQSSWVTWSWCAWTAHNSHRKTFNEHLLHARRCSKRTRQCLPWSQGSVRWALSSLFHRWA